MDNQISNVEETNEIILLQDAKDAIRININNVVKSFVVIGYYLKYIRDNKMYENDGYESIWELAQAEFGISKSQASKFMNINDKFSQNGNSPVLVEKYRKFTSSKLAEMLYLNDEQLEQVTESTTVVQIREIKNADKVVSTSKQNDDEMIPGQMQVDEYPELTPNSQNDYIQGTTETLNDEVVSTSKQDTVTKKPYYECVAYRQYQYSTGCKDCNYDKGDCPYDRTGYFEKLKQKEEWSIHCEVLSEMCNAICKMSSYILEKNNYDMVTIKSLSRKDQEFSFGFGDDGAGHSKYDATCKNERYHVEEFDGTGKWTFEAGEVDQNIWNFNGRDWRHNKQMKSDNDAEEKKAKLIDELDLSVSAYNSLKKHGIDTIDQLCEHTEKELLSEWKIGDFYSRQIVKQLSEIGRELKQDKPVGENGCTGECFYCADNDCNSYQKMRVNCLFDADTKCSIYGSHSTAITVCGIDCKSSCCMNCKEECGARCNQSAHTQSWNEQSKSVVEEPDSVIQDKRCNNCNYDDMAPDKYRADHTDAKEFPCNGCDDKLNHWEPKVNHPAVESESVEILEADIVQTAPENKIPLKQVPDKWYYLVPIGESDITGKPIREGDILEWTDLGGNTKEYQVYYEARSFCFDICEVERVGTDTLKCIPNHMLCKAKIIRNVHVGEEFVPESVEQPEQSEPEQLVQPELPILKNNDQRKEFIDAYKTWPIWIDQKETGERYYRYDFENGDSMVIKVYWCNLNHFDYDLRKYVDEETYSHAEQYLLKCGKHFKNCQTNMTTLIDYLKEFQKK